VFERKERERGRETDEINRDVAKIESEG